MEMLVYEKRHNNYYDSFIVFLPSLVGECFSLLYIPESMQAQGTGAHLKVWTGVITVLYGNEWWRENLRMTRDTFE